MDDLLEILDKYKCHLKRGSLSMAEYLKINYDNYLKDLAYAANSTNNQLVGKEMSELVIKHLPDIKKISDDIIKVFLLYDRGKIISASNLAFEVFSFMKNHLMYRYYTGNDFNTYYRIRPHKTDSFDLCRKELFHIPISKKHLVRTERYSMPGHPCLYLSSQEELCWYECNKPEEFAIARFELPRDKDNCLKFVDFSENLMLLMHSFFCWFHNEDDKESVRKYLLKHLYSYPLRAACSVKVEYTEGNFKEEYIIPQMLVQWILNDDVFDGVRYESCSNSKEVKKMGGHNIVLVTSNYDSDGYDEKLRKLIMICEPVLMRANTAEDITKNYYDDKYETRQYF
ncbi:MAG: hypothetical protein U0L58_02985 [Ruminococcus sp.]|nr:hypothetical protein [Ruminococcus sp.]